MVMPNTYGGRGRQGGQFATERGRVEAHFRNRRRRRSTRKSVTSLTTRHGGSFGPPGRVGNGGTVLRLRSFGVRTPEPPKRRSVADANTIDQTCASARDVRVLSRLGRGVVPVRAGRRPIRIVRRMTVRLRVNKYNHLRVSIIELGNSPVDLWLVSGAAERRRGRRHGAGAPSGVRDRGRSGSVTAAF